MKEVSEESAREKNIRHGHISTLHIWWARRPLASSRATNYAALIPASKDVEEWDRTRQFIAKLSKWENLLDQGILEKARRDILEANGGKPPKVLDSFAGGGAIPLEALRLGCETYASDYNPVATLILKCTLEYPQKYGGQRKSEQGLVSEAGENRLLEDVRRWGRWVLEEAKKEIGRFYPSERDGSIPVGYIWARTIPCQNPSCNAEIPLMRRYWLAKKSNKRISLYPSVSDNKIEFKIVGTGYEDMPKGFEPEKGTVSRAVATCLVCGSVVDDKTTRKLFREGKAGQRMVAVVLHKKGSSGKKYRVATYEDIQTFNKAEVYLREKRKSLMSEWGLDPVPDEPTPEGKGRGAERAFSVRNYNMKTWGDLFNSRQKLALITFIENVRNVYKKMLDERYEEEYAKAVVSYLALAISRTADFTSNLARWKSDAEAIVQALTRQALAMVIDYTENNTVSDTAGTWSSLLNRMLRVLMNLSNMGITPAMVKQSSATSLGHLDNTFDAVLTDPPYYDNVPYSYLSDFYYVWLKRTLGDTYPEFFATPLTPKADEIVAYSHREGGWEGGKKFFEDMLKKSFMEINRVLKPNGIAVIVYAHKSTAAWETLINSLLDSGLVVTGAWPLHTEMKVRLRSMESAALASSIYMIARNWKREPTGFYKEIKDALQEHLNGKLDRLWNEGISGADFFISAIGSSIEVFGKYEKIIDDEGNVIRADKLLEEVRRIVTDYAVKQVLHNGFTEEISHLTRFYVLWRWAYGDVKVHFDDARKLAQGVGIDLAQEWNRGFIQKDKEFIHVLGPENRNSSDLDNPKELIDVLHKVLLLWKKGKNEDAVKILKETGFGKSDIFYRVAQAISETLPNTSREKKLLDGFLSGKDRISEHIRKQTGQTRLFE